MRDQTLTNSLANRVPQQASLGPRLAGLAFLCLTLFGLATLVGLVANGLA